LQPQRTNFLASQFDEANRIGLGDPLQKYPHNNSNTASAFSNTLL